MLCNLLTTFDQIMTVRPESASIDAHHHSTTQQSSPLKDTSMLLGATTADLALGAPQGAGGVRPPMGMMAPGSGSPAMNPAMQNFAGANPHAAVPPSSQQQQQQLVTKMQQCMQNVQKLQNMLTQGRHEFRGAADLGC